MACAKNISIQNTEEYNNYLNNYVFNNNNRNRKYQSGYPPFTPIIKSLSVTSSYRDVYSTVIIQGSNFLPPSYGKTYVDFGPFNKFSGYFTHLPITFYNTTFISFVVPLNMKLGKYNVQVGNVYNNNFSPGNKQSNSGRVNLSNSKIYTIT